MTKQTFAILFIDADGHMLNFERWRYKRLSTCIAKTVELYRGLLSYSFIRDQLRSTVFVTAHETDYEIRPDNLVWQVSIDEFRRLLA